MASASPTSTCLPCNALYEPNPDIAGQAIFLAFLAHTCIFIFLAMVVTPIVSFYLPPVPTYPGVIPGQGVELGAPPPNVEEIELALASGFRRPEPDAGPRYLYRCYCQQAIESTYTSQYISGIAFIVTAFVKWREISPYHLRVIYSIVSMHTTIGLVANYGRQSFLSLLFARLLFARLHRTADRAPSWDSLVYEALDSAFLLNLVLLGIFTVLVPVYSYRDQCFQPCYNKSGWTYAVSVWSFLFLFLFSIHRNGDNGPFGWTILTTFIAFFIGFQVWQFRELTHIFRPITLYPGISSELVFSFGQILVLFMIFPLVTEFLGALYVDIKRILEHVGQDAPAGTLFINFFKMLLPWFFNRLVAAIYTGLNGLLTLLVKGASKIKAVVSFSRSRSPRRSNTSRLESGSTDSRDGSNVEPQSQSGVSDDGNEIQPTTSASTLGVSRRSTYPLPQDDEPQVGNFRSPQQVAQADLTHE